jgi:hypothetical protein
VINTIYIFPVSLEMTCLGQLSRDRTDSTSAVDNHDGVLFLRDDTGFHSKVSFEDLPDRQAHERVRGCLLPVQTLRFGSDHTRIDHLILCVRPIAMTHARVEHFVADLEERIAPGLDDDSCTVIAANLARRDQFEISLHMTDQKQHVSPMSELTMGVDIYRVYGTSVNPDKNVMRGGELGHRNSHELNRIAAGVVFHHSDGLHSRRQHDEKSRRGSLSSSVDKSLIVVGDAAIANFALVTTCTSERPSSENTR